MFTSYDLIPFGQRLRSIRKNLGYSQKEVSKLSGINVDTLRKLESGQSIPRFDTLEHLTHIYKTNLLLLLDAYKSSKALFHYYDQIDQLITSNDLEKIQKIKSQFDHDHKAQKDTLINARDYDQLNMFFEALILSYDQDSKVLEKAIGMLTDSLSLTLIGFEVDNFGQFKYNFFEQRILFLIASILVPLNKSNLSNKILKHLLNAFDFSIYSSLNEKRLIAKSYSLIAYNYHMIDAHDQVIQYANMGIQHCITHEISTYLYLLLSRKGLAEYNLNNPNYKISLKKALQLLNIYENHSVYQQYKDIMANQYQIYVD